MTSDLHPPEAGLASDPVLYGVAAALADLFPPIVGQAGGQRDDAPFEDGEPDRD